MALASLRLGGDETTKLWDRNGNQVGEFAGGYPATISPDWQTIAVVTKPFGFDTTGTIDSVEVEAPPPIIIDATGTIRAANSKIPTATQVVNLYRIDLNLDSLLRRACQRLKPYILDDPQQTTEQAQCETQLGESWQGQRTSK